MLTLMAAQVELVLALIQALEVGFVSVTVTIFAIYHAWCLANDKTSGIMLPFILSPFNKGTDGEFKHVDRCSSLSIALAHRLTPGRAA
jgi:hypothetical protein